MIKQKLTKTWSHIRAYRVHYLWLFIVLSISSGATYLLITNTDHAKADDAVTITSPAEGATLSSANPTITGTAEANTKVFIKVDNNYIGSTTSEGDGDWSFIVSQVSLTNSAHTVTASTESSLAYIACGGGGECDDTNTFSSYDMASGNQLSNIAIPTTGQDLGPIGVVSDVNQERAYVATNTPGSIKVINTTTETVEDTIPLSSCDCQSLTKPVLNADKTRLFVGINDPGDHKIAVINTDTSSVETEIAWPGGNTQSSVAITTNNEKTLAYISGTDGKVYKFNLETNSFEETINLPEIVSLGSMVVDGAGSALYGVADTNKIYQLDLINNVAYENFDLPIENDGQLNSIAITSNNVLYISRYFDDILTVNLNDTTLGSISGTEDAGDLSLNSNTDRLFASNSLAIIDTSNDQLISQQDSAIGGFFSLDMDLAASSTTTSEEISFNVNVTTPPAPNVHITSPTDGRTLSAGDRTVTGTVNPAGSTVLLSFDDGPEIPVVSDGDGNWSYETSFNDNGQHSIKARFHTDERHEIYIPNNQSSTVSIVNTDTNAVMGTVSTAPYLPASVTVNHAGTKAYIGETLGGWTGNRIQVLDLYTYELEDVITYGAGFSMASIVGLSDTTLYVRNDSLTDVGTYQILKIDLATNTITATYNGTSAVAVSQPSMSPDGTKIYTSGSGPISGDESNQSILKIIDANTLTEIDDIIIPVDQHGSFHAFDVVIGQDGNTAYLATGDAEKIIIVNLDTEEVTAINANGSHLKLFANEAQTKIYTFDSVSKDIIIYNLSDETSVNIPTTQNSFNLAIDSNLDQSKIYFPNNDLFGLITAPQNSIMILDTDTETILPGPDLGLNPSSVGSDFFGLVAAKDFNDQVSIEIIPRVAPAPAAQGGSGAGNNSDDDELIETSQFNKDETSDAVEDAPIIPFNTQSQNFESPSNVSGESDTPAVVTKALNALADIATRLTPGGNTAVIPLGIILIVGWLVFWLASLVTVERRHTHKYKELTQTLVRRQEQLRQISNLLMHYLNTPLTILRAGIEEATSKGTVFAGPAIKNILSSLGSNVELYLNEIQTATGSTSTTMPQMNSAEAKFSKTFRKPYVWMAVVSSGSLIGLYLYLVQRSGQLHISSVVLTSAVVGWLSISLGVIFTHHNLLLSRGQRAIAAQAVELSKRSVAVQVSLMDTAAVKIEKNRSELEILLGKQATQPHIHAGLEQLRETFERLQEASVYAQNNSTEQDQEKMDILMKQLSATDETLQQAGNVAAATA